MEELEDNEDDQFFFSRAPRMPEDDIIMSEVAILTGGRDQHGRPIIAFPARYHTILESKVKASGMDSLLRYYIDITRVADRKRGFAFVTDLRFSTLDFILLMKSILNSIQAEMKGAIGTCVLYAILPLNKKTHKDTLTHLALRQSKKKMNKNIIPPYFQSVAIDDEVELYNYIEKSHLTPELGGYLQYSHRDWVAFRKIVEPLFGNFEFVQVRLSDTYQHLSAMAKTNVGHSKEQLQQTHSQLQETYYDIRRGLQLDQVLDQCEELLARFSSCDEEDVFTVLAQKPVFKETKEMVEGCRDQLIAAKKKIEDDWHSTSSWIIQAIQLIEYREDVNKLLDWLKSKKERDLQHVADIADNLSRAEMLCNHFETGFLLKAEEKMSRVSDLVQQGEEMAMNNGNSSRGEIMTLANTLKQHSKDFQNALQKHQHILQSVYRFHQLYNEARRWYISCIKFLPPDLYDLYTDLKSHSQSHDSQALRLQWEEDVRRFLHKHPLMAKEELKQVKLIPEDIGAASLKKKGRLLSYRCLILTNLLSHRLKISASNIRDILKWQSEIRNRSDDSASHQSERLPSSDRMHKVSSSNSLDSSDQTRHEKPDKGRQGKSHLAKTKVEKEDFHNRGTQTPDRVRRHNKQRDIYPDNSNSVEDTDDDPLIQKIGHPGSFYDKYSNRQGQIMSDDDAADGIRKTQEDVQRNKNISTMAEREIAHAQQASVSQPTVLTEQTVRGHSPSRQSSREYSSQKYGIYGDSDFEDDTAVTIHHKGHPPLPQGLSEYLLPGNQMHHQDNHFILSSSDPSNVVGENQISNYGLMQPDPTQTTRYPPQLGAYDAHSQHTAVPNGAPAILNTNQSSSLDLHSQPENRTSPYQLRPTSSSQRSLPQRPPMSFHGSLMNIHQLHVDNDFSATGEPHARHNEVLNSSPLTKHRSLINLSQSPIMDQTHSGIIQNNSIQTSPVRSNHKVYSSPSSGGNASMQDSRIYLAEDGSVNPYWSVRPLLQHGMSEPNVNTPFHDDVASPYSQVLTNLMTVRQVTSARPFRSRKRPNLAHSKSKKINTLDSHSVSRSEMDLQSVPRNHSLPNGLSVSEQALHHDEPSHEQSSPPNITASAYPSVVGSDPQVEYYKKLYSSSTPQLNHSTSASGHKKREYTLDPSGHTWMHDIPVTQTRRSPQLSARIPSSLPLSPLALLELEVAKETMDAKDAKIEDEYNEEQKRRQGVIDSIVNQSKSSIISHDERASLDRIQSKGHKGRSLEKRKKHANALSPPRNVDEKLRNSSPNVFISREGQYLSLHQNGQSSSFQPQEVGMKLENGWKRHFRDSFVSPVVAYHSTPVSVHRPSAKHQFSLSTTLPQDQQIQALLTSNERDYRQREQLVGNAQRHTVYKVGESPGISTAVYPRDQVRRRQAEMNWRQEHLRELDLSPKTQPHLLGPHLRDETSSEPLSDWREQHLQDLGITPSMPQSNLRYNPTSRNPSSISASEDYDWRNQHLIDLGISPNMHQFTGNQVPTQAETSVGFLIEGTKNDWRKQHLLELGLSPNMHLSRQKQRSVIERESTRNLESNSALGLNKPVEPIACQRAVTRSVDLRDSVQNIAPMTGRSQGVNESGRSLDDMDEIHQLTDETAKKSFRFAHLSDETILDAEEKVQEELAQKLHLLELKLKAEETSLMYSDLLDTEKAGLNLELRDLDQEEAALQRDTNHQGISHLIQLNGDVRPTHLIGQRNQQVAKSPQPTPSEENVLSQRFKRSQPVHASQHPGQPGKIQGDQYTAVNKDQSSHPRLLQGAVQPSVTWTTQCQEANQHRGYHATLSNADSAKQVKAQLLFNDNDEGAKNGAKKLPQESVGSRDVLQKIGSGTVKIMEKSLYKVNPNQSDIIEYKSYNGTSDVNKVKDKANGDIHVANTQDVLDDQHHTVSAQVQDHSVAGADAKQIDLVNHHGNIDAQKSADSGRRIVNSVSGYGEGQELVDKPAKDDSSMLVLPDNRYNGGSREPTRKEPNGVMKEEKNESDKSVTNATKRHQALVNSRDVEIKELVDNERMLEADRVVPREDLKQTLSERDHTAADYIACALGMDFVNDKASLTVQPYSNSSKSITQQLDEQRLELNNQNTPRVNLPKSQGSLDEGPCSPIRQWLKEKESLEIESGQSGYSEQNLTGRVEDEKISNVDFAHSAVESPINASHAQSPTMRAQSTSPIRQWLREQEEKEARLKQDSSMIDLGKGSDVRPVGSSGDLESSRDLKQSPDSTRRRTNSLIPIPVDSKRIPGALKHAPSETRQKSSSSIPVYKGLSKSSPKEPSPSLNLEVAEKAPEHTLETLASPGIRSRKSNPYSKIPVKKVYTALKEGGYLEEKHHQQKSQQLPASEKQKTHSKVQHSDDPNSERSGPVLQRQGTFTKEPRPTLTREGTFTIDTEQGRQESQDAIIQRKATEEKNAHHSSGIFSPLALVLDHMVKKGNTSTPVGKQEKQDWKKHPDSTEETFENSSTESSMSPTTKSTVVVSKNPTTNLHNTKNYYISVQNNDTNNKGEITAPGVLGQRVYNGSYNGLTESDRKEQDDLDDSELEKMMTTKSQLAEIRNLEIENRHLAYERKEIEAHLIKNIKQQAHVSDEG
ncbi:uncharacterized protein LOC110983040 isoform X2 [Acanthaster planci]|uniref:Uncharacterized protein LOC110983040 isoform X2 n=1 Tax=Acanthaster planci TaxID=133434 RepID=A0A8B7YY42_ACAPL|nr:uncharacterized protein LOC110983040 isoform X2 [Acanthaster planci]